ncbi:MAG: lipid-A-disaccharide synthase [Archangium sp.]|nr:lipid-A-disaccharide synthase [Archangium sp.]MDP3155673.1 lipid-A-disaccharide synthase [Archangium sp.]MDP3569778.1 lipid-A-disaccharide synthase [Archangium sp.]
MDVLVVAGEASGDQHAADVVAALKLLRPDLRFFGMGGPRLAAQGVELIHGAHEISVMGIVEVVPKIPRIWRVLGDLEKAAKERKPAVALLVDVPDFNLRLAKRLKALGVPIAYYVAPMAWAWRESRTKTIAARVDRLLCILPFEEAFFRTRGVNATYVGNPVIDQLPAPATPNEFRQALGLTVEAPVFAVLPGSRRSEISRLGPTLAAVAAKVVAQRPGTRVVVPVAPGLPREFVEAPFLAAGVTPVLVDGRAAEVVGACDVALVASGTATLEAGLMRRPLVAVYRVNGLSYAIGKMLVRVPFFCLVNLLVGKKVVPELLQGDMTVDRIVEALEPLWAGPAREECLAGLELLREKLGTGGASIRVAKTVLELCQ